MKVAPSHPGAVGGADTAPAGAGPVRQKVAHGLGRGPVAAADLISPLLNFPLPAHSAQSSLIGKIGGVHRHQQGRVGVLPFPVSIAHAVGDDAPGFTGRRHHMTARAHTEGVHRGILQMLHQLVVRRGQGCRFRAVLGKIDDALLLLNPRAHGEGLWLHGNAGFFQHFEGVPGAVADGENRRVTVDNFPGIGFQAGKLSIFDAKARDLRVEPHLPAERNDPLSQVLHHSEQNIRAHMGLGVVENVLPGPGLHELLQHPADAGVIDTGVQLAVGEGARAALAELDVAFFVQNPGCKEFFHLFVAGLRVLSPLQNQRLPACQGQNQGGKHPRRAEAHHHGPLVRDGHIFWRFIEGRWGNGGLFAAAGP